MRLHALENAYRVTQNPLYLWKIIGVSLADLNDQEPLPVGVLKYLRWVSVQLEKASQTGRVRGPQAVQLAAHALYMVSRKGQRNAFAALARDTEDVALARAAQVDRKGALAEAKRRLRIDDEQARKRLARGRRLLGDC